jgi:undecaprenol kinase
LIGFIIAAVLAFETVNAALESLIDHLHPDIHPEIRVIKDMAAGAVLLVVIGAVAVGGVLLAATVRGG